MGGKNIAFIGLGVMGYHMAKNLANNGHSITVFNRTIQKAQKWIKEYSGKIASTPAEAVLNAEFVFSCVGNDDDLLEITIGENGAFQNMQKGSIFIDNTTTSAGIAIKLAEEAKKRGIFFLDSPVSGGEVGAINGVLTVMVGGDYQAYKQAEMIIKCFAKKVKYMGESGKGQLTKMVNQICITGIIQGLAEAINFAKDSNLNISDVVDVLSKGAAQSWQMENRYEAMDKGEFNFGFAVDLMRKDLNICLNEANKINSPLPMTALIDQFYAEVQNIGGGRWDTCGLIKRLQDN